MTSIRPRLIVLKGSSSTRRGGARPPLDAIRSVADVIEVENVEAARALICAAEPGTLVFSTDIAVSLAAADDGGESVRLLQQIGEGVGVINGEGRMVWGNEQLCRQSEEVRERFADTCHAAIELLNRDPAPDQVDTSSIKLAFSTNDTDYEVGISPAAHASHGPAVTEVVGVLWDVTHSRRLQRKIDAIDEAGAELMRIESATTHQMTMAERLRVLEERIVLSVHDLLEFDNFEIRLLDKQSNRLELVVAVGISPLKIGEVIHAATEGNGISGWVAATGRSYVCPDVRADGLYSQGLPEALSTLTVPLRLHDEVIGVFNVESHEINAFDDNDRQFAEIFGRYVAMAMHILDLLVVERYTTNEQIAANVLGELSVPIDELSRETDKLLAPDRADDGAGGVIDSGLRGQLEAIRDAAATIRRRISTCTGGPNTILGAEQELSRYESDPIFRDRHVLLADNEDEIREGVRRILEQKGCIVTAFETGLGAIEALEAASGTGTRFDLVISDIKMPDRTGYEVFRAVKNMASHLPVILMTGFGYDPHHSSIRASQEGLHALLFKPFKATQLIESVARAFEPEASTTTDGEA